MPKSIRVKTAAAWTQFHRAAMQKILLCNFFFEAKFSQESCQKQYTLCGNLAGNLVLLSITFLCSGNLCAKKLYGIGIWYLLGHPRLVWWDILSIQQLIRWGVLSEGLLWHGACINQCLANNGQASVYSVWLVDVKQDVWVLD